MMLLVLEFQRVSWHAVGSTHNENETSRAKYTASTHTNVLRFLCFPSAGFELTINSLKPGHRCTMFLMHQAHKHRLCSSSCPWKEWKLQFSAWIKTASSSLVTGPSQNRLQTVNCYVTPSSLIHLLPIYLAKYSVSVYPFQAASFFCKLTDTLYPSCYNKNLWLTLFLLLCSKAMKSAPLWHLSRSILPCLQNCVKSSLLHTIPQVISNSVFLLASPMYGAKYTPSTHSITIRYILSVCVCVQWVCMVLRKGADKQTNGPMSLASKLVLLDNRLFCCSAHSTQYTSVLFTRLFFVSDLRTLGVMTEFTWRFLSVSFFLFLAGSRRSSTMSGSFSSCREWTRVQADKFHSAFEAPSLTQAANSCWMQLAFIIRKYGHNSWS